jgi:RNA polymerase sigma-70 factor (ECF subfamily)
MQYVHDLDTAKDLVHNVFINLWEKREDIDPNKSVKSYLFTAVYNRSLNHIRDHKKFHNEDISEYHDRLAGTQEDYYDKVESSELSARIKNAIDTLPERCREIFLLNRFEEMKYKEIAEKLDISIKTVEAQMSKALKILREQLTDYIGLLVFIILTGWGNF